MFTRAWQVLYSFRIIAEYSVEKFCILYAAFFFPVNGPTLCYAPTQHGTIIITEFDFNICFTANTFML